MSAPDRGETATTSAATQDGQGSRAPTPRRRELTVREAQIHWLIKRDRLRGRETSTTALVQRHGLNRSTLQGHLRSMKRKGHVTRLTDGTWVEYDLHLASVAQRQRVQEATSRDARKKVRERRRRRNSAVFRYQQGQERRARANQRKAAREASETAADAVVTRTVRVLRDEDGAATQDDDQGGPDWLTIAAESLDALLEELGLLAEWPDTSHDDGSPP